MNNHQPTILIKIGDDHPVLIRGKQIAEDQAEIIQVPPSYLDRRYLDQITIQLTRERMGISQELSEPIYADDGLINRSIFSTFVYLFVLASQSELYQLERQLTKANLPEKTYLNNDSVWATAEALFRQKHPAYDRTKYDWPNFHLSFACKMIAAQNKLEIEHCLAQLSCQYQPLKIDSYADFELVSQRIRSELKIPDLLFSRLNSDLSN